MPSLPAGRGKQRNGKVDPGSYAVIIFLRLGHIAAYNLDHSTGVAVVGVIGDAALNLVQAAGRAVEVAVIGQIVIAGGKPFDLLAASIQQMPEAEVFRFKLSDALVSLQQGRGN